MTDIISLRNYVCEWADYSTNGATGRQVGDPVFRAFTEGLDPGPVFSSCPTMPTGVLFLMGCREDWLNRKQHKGFTYGVGINKLVHNPIGSNPIAREVRSPYAMVGGDIGVTWSNPNKTRDAHVFIFDRVENGYVHTWDYGQAPTDRELWEVKSTWIEARKCVRPLSQFHLRSSISLADVPFTAAPRLPVGEVFDYIERHGELPDD